MTRTVYAVHVTITDELYLFENEDQAQDFADIHDAVVTEAGLLDREAADQLMAEEAEAFEEDEHIEQWEKEQQAGNGS